MINAETAARSAVAKHHDALAYRGVVVEQRWKSRRGAFLVRRRQVKGGDRAGALPGDSGAKKAVAGDGIAARAVVPHDDCRVVRRGVETIVERQGLHAVRIMDAGSDDNR